MQINRAQDGNIDEMIALDALVIGNTSRHDFIAQVVRQQQGYIAQQENQIVGFLLMQQHFFGYPFIELLIVHPSFRRRGIGGTLIRYIEPLYAPGKLFTSTNASNEQMQRLCEHSGYLRSGVIENLDDGDPEIVYFKRLSHHASLIDNNTA